MVCRMLLVLISHFLLLVAQMARKADAGGVIIFGGILMRSRKFVFSAMCMALYIVTMAMTQSFAFGPYQIRIATAVYGLCALYPFLMVPLSLANVISNGLMGGLGILDMVGGFCVGMVTTGLIVWGKKYGLGNWIIGAAVTLAPGLMVPMWLCVIFDLPYWVLASSLLVGQCVCGAVSMIWVSALERVGAGYFLEFEGGNKK